MVRAVCLALVIIVGGMAPGAADELLPKKWSSSHFASNPLVGRIFSGTGKEVEASKLLAALRKADYTLVGEIHSNPDHHVVVIRVTSIVVINIHGGIGRRTHPYGRAFGFAFAVIFSAAVTPPNYDLARQQLRGDH